MKSHINISIVVLVLNLAIIGTSSASPTFIEQILNFSPTSYFAGSSGPDIFDNWFFEITKNQEGVDQYTRRDYGSRTFKIGARIGCMVTFDRTKKRHVLVTELRGPSSLMNFHPKADSVKHSSDGRSVMTKGFTAENETSAGFWYSIDPGDPVGSYELTCTLDGESAGSYEFDVE